MADGETEFAGRVCIVSGGARGIGRAIVMMFRARGAVVHSIDLGHGPRDHGETNVFCHDCDITDAEAVVRLMAGVGQVDVLVNNAAAVTRPASLTDILPAEWAQALAVNVTGTFNLSRASLPRMGKGGVVVNLASTFAHVGAPQRVAYSTTKGAILAFTRSLALEVAGLGIRVNSVSPGGVATDRLVEQFGSLETAEAQLGPAHPVGHLGAPEDIAEAVGFLASPRARFVTGADLLVDGGYTAR